MIWVLHRRTESDKRNATLSKYVDNNVVAAKYDRYIFFKLLMNLESSGVLIPFWENVNISVPCLKVFYARQTEKRA